MSSKRNKKKKKVNNDFGTWKQFLRFSVVAVVLILIAFMYALAAILL